MSFLLIVFGHIWLLLFEVVYCYCHSWPCKYHTFPHYEVSDHVWSGTSLVYGSRFGQMPFLSPPVTRIWLQVSNPGLLSENPALKHCAMATVVILTISLSLHFNGHFPGGPGFAGTRMSPFLILSELRIVDVVVTTAAIRHEKLQSNRHHQQTNTQCFTGWMPFLSPNQHCQSTEGNYCCQSYWLFFTTVD